MTVIEAIAVTVPVCSMLVALAGFMRVTRNDSNGSAARIERIDVNVQSIITRLDKMEENQDRLETRVGKAENRISHLEEQVLIPIRRLDRLEEKLGVRD